MKTKVTLGWGKYAGSNLLDPAEVPDAYIIWMLDKIHDLGPTMTEILRTRLGLSPQAPKRDTKPLSLSDDLEARILRRWYRIMEAQFGKDDTIVKTGLDVLLAVLRHANSKVDVV